MNLKMQVEVKGIEDFNNLIELLRTKFDELPYEIKDAITKIEEFGISDFDAEKAREVYGDYEKYESSFGEQNIIRINKILKKITYIISDGKNITEHTAYPDHFWHSFDGKKVIEW